MLFKTLSTSVYGIDAYLVQVKVVGSAYREDRHSCLSPCHYLGQAAVEDLSPERDRQECLFYTEGTNSPRPGCSIDSVSVAMLPIER